MGDDLGVVPYSGLLLIGSRPRRRRGSDEGRTLLLDDLINRLIESLYMGLIVRPHPRAQPSERFIA